MKISRSVWVLLVVLFSAVPGFARAADVAVFPVENTNLAPEDAAAIGELLAQSYAAVTNKAVIAPSRTQATLSMSPSYVDAARSLGVSEFIRISAVAAGRKMVIQSTLHKQDGQTLFQTKMTAESIEDMTNVADRMARALSERVSTEEVRTHYNVTANEGRAKNRLWTEKVFGIKTGVHIPVAKRAEYAPHLSLQFNGRLELDRFFLEFGGGIIVPTEVDADSCWDDYESDCAEDNRGGIGGLTAELGGSVFLNDGNAAVYVGGGFIPRLTFVNDVATASIYGQIGVMLPREASTRFYADLRVAQSIIEQHLDNGWGRYPTEFTLHVGIGW